MANLYAATGRRKTASVRARLTPGEGTVTVNGRSLEEYFPTVSHQITVKSALQVTGNAQKFDVDVKAKGGGLSGQAGAVRLAISRALLEVDPTFRPALKAEGFLTRDGRMKERKKSGQPGARKRFQFSKR
jgi:small subunit ribosomal protein S9